MAIGGGRRIKQSLTIIDEAIADGTLFTHQLLVPYLKLYKKRDAHCILWDCFLMAGCIALKNMCTPLLKWRFVWCAINSYSCVFGRA